MKKDTSPVVVNKMAYRPVPMDLGFIVLCFDADPYKPLTTLSSIDRAYPGAKTEMVSPPDFKHIHKSAITGKGSLTSLINAGMSKPPAEWNVIVMAGVRVKEQLDKKYSPFMESRLDIFFPLIFGFHNFLDAPMNGLTIHRDTFKEVGKFADDNPLEICKMMWFLEAHGKNCKFKAVAGCRMC
jgi:hypothetical protein